MNAELLPSLARARAGLEALARDAEHTQLMLDQLRREIAWIEGRIANTSKPARSREIELRLDAMLSELDEQIDGCERERRMIDARRGLAERRLQSTGERLVDLGERRELLLNLWVASSQLREAEDLERARAAILEIVINLVGCEEVGLFEASPSGDRSRGLRCFALTSSLGLNPARSRDIQLGQGWLGQRLAEGRAFVLHKYPPASDEPRVRGLSACLPLAADGRVIAALLLFGLLPHKSGLAELDRHLLELLRGYAGPVLARHGRHASASEDASSRTWSQA